MSDQSQQLVNTPGNTGGFPFEAQIDGVIHRLTAVAVKALTGGRPGQVVFDSDGNTYIRSQSNPHIWEQVAEDALGVIHEPAPEQTMTGDSASVVPQLVEQAQKAEVTNAAIDAAQELNGTTPEGVDAANAAAIAGETPTYPGEDAATAAALGTPVNPDDPAFD